LVFGTLTRSSSADNPFLAQKNIEAKTVRMIHFGEGEGFGLDRQAGAQEPEP
jgi:hypothetical protein